MGAAARGRDEGRGPCAAKNPIIPASPSRHLSTTSHHPIKPTNQSIVDFGPIHPLWHSIAVFIQQEVRPRDLAAVEV